MTDFSNMITCKIQMSHYCQFSCYPTILKFCMAVWPHLTQVFSHFGWPEFWASTGTIWWDMLLAEALVFNC